VNSLAHDEYNRAAWYGAIAVLLCMICFLSIYGCKRTLQKEPLVTKKIRTADKEVLAFLLVYLLPLFSKDVATFTGNYLTATYVFVVIAWVVYHSNSFSFNPLLAAIGYHFYEIDSEGGMTYLLVSKQALHRHDNKLTVVQLSDYIYLDAGTQDG
jgi:hypothetical protein